MHTQVLALFSLSLSEYKVSCIEYCLSFMKQRASFSFQFHVPGNNTHYHDLYHTEIYVRMKIEEEDGESFYKTKEASS